MRYAPFLVLALLVILFTPLAEAAAAAEVVPGHSYAAPPAIGVAAMVLGLAAFKITGAVRHGGTLYTEGDEDALAESGADLEALKEAGVIEGDVPGDEGPAGYPEDFPAAETLAEAGYASAEEVQGTSDEELLDVNGIGEATLEEIRDY